ncbi:MAG: hypothetical protein JNN30_20105 [Rhodanobacteraceae bacterium]|nr:hypothetical protein [Rhodanobacteraceae bacterium]
MKTRLPSAQFASSLLVLLVGLCLVACGDAAPKLGGAALVQRRAETREAAARRLTSADLALLGREELIIRDEQLITPAVDRIMANLETWLDGDESRLLAFLETQVISARDELVTSSEGIAALDRLAQVAFANPRTTLSEGSLPGRKASNLEKSAADVAGKILSGRPAQARDLPPSHWIEVHADFGLVPAPLEVNPRNKQAVSLLRHRQDTGQGWFDDAQRERPRTDVVARAARDLLHHHPGATRAILRMQVLRSAGAPVTWEFLAEPSDDGAITLSGTGNAPGYLEDFGTHQTAIGKPNADSVPDGEESVMPSGERVYRDRRSGRILGSASTSPGGTTTYRDADGRISGNESTSPSGRTTLRDGDGRISLDSDTTPGTGGDSTTTYRRNGVIVGQKYVSPAGNVTWRDGSGHIIDGPSGFKP